ncbi:MAG: DUF3243 family protein [Solibacillus sp.]|uniref:DUF3243 family protein n=1 Tax=unclassified Solibacillus TaxID=2637870 RepID=UPI0031016AFA
MSEELNQVDQKLKDLSPEEKDRILNNFNQFKSYLNEQLSKGKRLGLSDEFLAKGAKFVADHLAKNEEPRNSEQKLLQEMWKVSDDEAKKHIALALVKMIQTD